jgi:membrane protein
VVETHGGVRPPEQERGRAHRLVGVVRRIPGVLVASVQRFVAAGCQQHAAGIAYRVLFSFAPLAIVLLSIFGLVLQDDSVRADVITRIVDALPVDAGGGADVQRAIENIATPASAAGFVSLLAFLWAATAMMGAIRQGLEAAMGVERGHPAVRGKLVDLALIAGAAVLVLLSVGFGLVAEAAGRFVRELAPNLGEEGDLVQTGLATGLPFLLSVVTVLLLYRFVPSARLRFSAALAGAVVTGILLAAISFASGLVYARTTRLSVIYGSLTSILVFLYSVYLYANALLLGASVAAEWSRPPDPGPGEPIGIRIRRGVRGLFVRDSPPGPPGPVGPRPETGDHEDAPR